MTRLLRMTTFLFALIVLPVVAWAQSGNYLIQRGDTLRVEVMEDATLNRDALVLPDGRITIPLAGSVIAAGRSVSQVSAALKSRLTEHFAVEPTVFVSVNRLAEREALPEAAEVEPLLFEVFVLGEASNPGRLQIEPGTTVLQLFAQMGGFTNFAALKRIQLRRTDSTGTEKIYTLNYSAIQDGTSRAGLTTMQDGDVIVVPQRRLFE